MSDEAVGVPGGGAAARGIEIRTATLDDLAAVAPLFAAYREFYGRPYDLDIARQFLADRIRNGESVVLLASDRAGGRDAAGFAQLYPTFSSVSAAPRWVLNDLFVAPAGRRRGVARALMRQAEVEARRAGAVGLSLSTAVDNTSAQALYRSEGYGLDTAFQHYDKPLT
ncbi:MAG: GNAT family N-acetyltransferase [Actinomycetota bacterium]|nr:GNAT family N-acetyltransferase [Actinomycetota bacterium]